MNLLYPKIPLALLPRLLHGSDYSSWESMASKLGIVNLPSFVRVAYIHNAGYLGGLIGLVSAIFHLRNRKR